MSFSLHPQLAADTVPVCDLDLCRVLLCTDSTYPWLILSPMKEGLRDLHDLDDVDGVSVMAEIRQCSQALVALFGPDKMNVAALGNAVPQLHIHVIARFETDAAWPGPIWGKAPAKPYDDDKRDGLVATLRDALRATG